MSQRLWYQWVHSSDQLEVSKSKSLSSPISNLLFFILFLGALLLSLFLGFAFCWLVVGRLWAGSPPARISLSRKLLLGFRKVNICLKTLLTWHVNRLRPYWNFAFSLLLKWTIIISSKEPFPDTEILYGGSFTTADTEDTIVMIVRETFLTWTHARIIILKDANCMIR